jgi:hypothetical protein
MVYGVGHGEGLVVVGLLLTISRLSVRGREVAKYGVSGNVPVRKRKVRAESLNHASKD